MEQITIEELRRLFPDASESTLRRNRAILEAATKGFPVLPQYDAQEITCEIVPAQKKLISRRRIRQSSKPLLNKLETEFLCYITSQNPWKDDVFWQQALRFRLGNGIWYKPDFVVRSGSGAMIAFEVKGPHAFRGGFENLKVAASQYPEIKWILAWKEDGRWIQQEVLP